jgi:hypothetical protein
VYRWCRAFLDILKGEKVNTFVLVVNLFLLAITWILPFVLIGACIWTLLHYKEMKLRKLDERGVFWTAILGIAVSLLVFAWNLGLIR